jgi:hypothetical protein
MDFMGKDGSIRKDVLYQLVFAILTDKSYTVYSSSMLSPNQVHFLGVEEKKTEDTESDEL